MFSAAVSRRLAATFSVDVLLGFAALPAAFTPAIFVGSLFCSTFSVAIFPQLLQDFEPFYVEGLLSRQSFCPAVFLLPSSLGSFFP